MVQFSTKTRRPPPPPFLSRYIIYLWRKDTRMIHAPLFVCADVELPASLPPFSYRMGNGDGGDMELSISADRGEGGHLTPASLKKFLM